MNYIIKNLTFTERDGCNYYIKTCRDGGGVSSGAIGKNFNPPKRFNLKHARIVLRRTKIIGNQLEYKIEYIK